MKGVVYKSCCRRCHHVYVSAGGSNPSIDGASELAKLLLSQGYHSRDATSFTPYTRKNAFDKMYDP